MLIIATSIHALMAGRRLNELQLGASERLQGCDFDTDLEDWTW
jgi:hypothetical protein